LLPGSEIVNFPEVRENPLELFYEEIRAMKNYIKNGRGEGIWNLIKI